MKILHIIPNLKKGGAERIALDTCISLSQKPGSKVVLVSFQEGNDYTFLSNKIDHRFIPSFYNPSIFSKSKKSINELEEFICQFNPDVIHCHLFESIILLTQLSFSCKRICLHFHDKISQLRKFTCQKLLSKITWTDLYERKLVVSFYRKRNTKLIAVSENTLSYIKTELPFFYAELLHNAIDVSRFEQNMEGHLSNRITMIGSLVENKNQVLAIQVLSKLHQRRVSIHLDLVGNGKMRNQLELLSENLQLTNFVHFHGIIDFPEKVLAQSNIYLHTSISEAFGLTLIEAMACGLPVVSTNGKGNADLIKNGYNGFLVDKFDPEILADKIETILNDQELRIQMGENARKFSLQFGINEYTKKLYILYKS
jgi:glycosyltransferase involved in cell wall biosynthesis